MCVGSAVAACSTICYTNTKDPHRSVKCVHAEEKEKKIAFNFNVFPNDHDHRSRCETLLIVDLSRCNTFNANY